MAATELQVGYMTIAKKGESKVAPVLNQPPLHEDYGGAEVKLHHSWPRH
jgi:hypothetical protein